MICAAPAPIAVAMRKPARDLGHDLQIDDGQRRACGGHGLDWNDEEDPQSAARLVLNENPLVARTKANEIEARHRIRVGDLRRAYDDRCGAVVRRRRGERLVGQDNDRTGKRYRAACSVRGCCPAGAGSALAAAYRRHAFGALAVGGAP